MRMIGYRYKLIIFLQKLKHQSDIVRGVLLGKLGKFCYLDDMLATVQMEDVIK